MPKPLSHTQRALDGRGLDPAIDEFAVRVVRDGNVFSENAHADQRLKAVADADDQTAALGVGPEIPLELVLNLEREHLSRSQIVAERKSSRKSQRLETAWRAV